MLTDQGIECFGIVVVAIASQQIAVALLMGAFVVGVFWQVRSVPEIGLHTTLRNVVNRVDPNFVVIHYPLFTALAPTRYSVVRRRRGR